MSEYRIYYPFFDYTEQETYPSILRAIEGAKWDTFHVIDNNGDVFTGKGEFPAKIRTIEVEA